MAALEEMTVVVQLKNSCGCCWYPPARTQQKSSLHTSSDARVNFGACKLTTCDDMDLAQSFYCRGSLPPTFYGISGRVVCGTLPL